MKQFFDSFSAEEYLAVCKKMQKRCAAGHTVVLRHGVSGGKGSGGMSQRSFRWFF